MNRPTDALVSEPCRWCGARTAVPPKNTSLTQLLYHEARCPLSVECLTCGAHQAEPCTTRTSGKRCPTHQNRRLM